MVATIQRKLNDSAAARWTALVLIALMMFFGYMFVDVMSPLKSLVESARGWDSSTFGTYASSEYFLNVFVFFLIFAGIILDKMGIRFTGLLSASLMVLGATIKLVGISDWFQTTEFCAWLNSWWVAFPGSAKMASLGFMIFGCGCEMAGTTVSKSIAKWFEGKEMALAMGLEMAIARLGVFAVMWLAPMISKQFDQSIVAPVAFCTVLLIIGLLCFTVFVFMDRKLDRQLIAAGELKEEKSSDEEFHIRDLGAIFRSKMFWLVALLCVLYYSAIFPFQRYAPNFLEVTLGIDAESAARLFSCFPILAMILTPFLGALLDFKGKGATMLMVGAVIMICCHLSFAFLLPLFPSKWLALLLVVTLGVSFSLVPAALWPSVPKIIDSKILGSAYCLIFWIQNIGLFAVPLLIGVVLDATGGYTVPMIIFSTFGVLAFIFSLYLKIEDRKKGYGLELPNVKR
ncbi:MAG TPA: MFS transporter [Candidatus Alistipes merdavium]|jgi:Nitrate/nitrite transporter|nr:MFS transporter [uncultured Alistipes sp.]HJC51930.1 MFS transporter [Candidatus Alistipes merdavium]